MPPTPLQCIESRITLVQKAQIIELLLYIGLETKFCETLLRILGHNKLLPSMRILGIWDFFVKIEFEVSLISSTLEVAHLQV